MVCLCFHGARHTDLVSYPQRIAYHVNLGRPMKTSHYYPLFILPFCLVVPAQAQQSGFGGSIAIGDDEIFVLLLSGYVSEEQYEHLGGTATIVARGFGGGNVILFMDNPHFRAFWYGTNSLFLNAVFLGDSF